ncbi:MAG: cell division protein ZapA [Hyphomicrobiaceae bacterium]
MGVVSLMLDGRNYRLGCGEGEETRLQALGDHLSGKVERLTAEHGAIGHDKLLVMAALLIADELFEARDANIDKVTSIAQARLAKAPKPESDL